MQESEPSSSMPKRRTNNSNGHSRANSGLKRSFVDTLAWIITFFWSISFVLDAIVISYDPPPTLHPLMMMVAGVAFGSTLLKDRNAKEANKNGEDDGKS